jgi:hypothetical protein
MKTFLFLVSFLLGQDAFAMGDATFFRGNPLSHQEKQHINDIQETTSDIQLFSNERGYKDQQMMEEKEVKKDNEKVKVKEVKKDKVLPVEKQKVNYE